MGRANDDRSEAQRQYCIRASFSGLPVCSSAVRLFNKVRLSWLERFACDGGTGGFEEDGLLLPRP